MTLTAPNPLSNRDGERTLPTPCPLRVRGSATRRTVSAQAPVSQGHDDVSLRASALYSVSAAVLTIGRANPEMPGPAREAGVGMTVAVARTAPRTLPR